MVKSLFVDGSKTNENLYFLLVRSLDNHRGSPPLSRPPLAPSMRCRVEQCAQQSMCTGARFQGIFHKPWIPPEKNHQQRMDLHYNC